MRRILFFLVFFFAGFFMLGADDDLYARLLEYHIKNSAVYKELCISAAIAANESEKIKFNSLIVAQTGSGPTTIGFGGSDGIDYSSAPFINFSLPSYNNAGLSVGIPFSKKGPLESLGVDIKISADLYSMNAQAQRLQRETAEKKAAEALEKKDAGRRIAEQVFLTEINKLFDSYLDMLDKNLSAVQAELQFEQVKVQGYEVNSTRYRTAQLRSGSAQRAFQTAEFSFKAAFARFAESCGSAETYANADSFLTRLAASIPQETIIELGACSVETSKRFIDAEYAYRQGAAQRAIANSPFSLSAEAGYGWLQTKNSLSGTVVAETGNSVSGGINMKFPGGSLSAGVSIPIENPKQPTLNMMFAWNPFFIKYQKLDNETARLQNEAALLKLDEARKEAEQELSQTRSQADVLVWARQSALEDASLYEQNARDHEAWFQKGLVGALDNVQSKLEYMKSLVRAGQAKAQVIIFNITTRLAFVMHSQGEK